MSWEEAEPLPEGWTWTTLNAIAEIKGGLTKGKKRSADDRLRAVPYLRVANVQRGHLELTEIKNIEATNAEIQELKLLRGDVLFNEGGDRDKLGRGWIWEEQLPLCVHQNHVFRARLFGGMALPKLVSLYGNSFGQKYFIGEGKQTTNLASINMTKLGALPIPLPPLPEQHRIVAKLDALQSKSRRAREALDAIPPLLERFRQSVLAAAFRGDLTADWRAKNPDVEPASELLKRIRTERRHRWEETELAKMQAKGKAPGDDRWKAKYEEPAPSEVVAPLPEGWTWTSLRAIAEIKGGLTKGQKRSPDERLRAVPYLRVANVQRGHLELTEMKDIEATEAEIQELKLLRGDVLFNEGGDRDKLGRGWIWDEQLPLCVHQNHVFRARLLAGMVLPKLVSWYGNSFGQRYFIDEGKQTTNLASINITKLGALPIPLPPLAEQHRIVAELERLLSTADETERTVRDQIAHLARLRESVLKRAFEGKLVPQDPNDEPAANLLARIASERDGAAAPKTGGRLAQEPSPPPGPARRSRRSPAKANG